jgi:hypothetical protein
MCGLAGSATSSYSAPPRITAWCVGRLFRSPIEGHPMGREPKRNDESMPQRTQAARAFVASIDTPHSGQTPDVLPVRS